ncbi:hypothetical protein [Photobacterium leiognathi]|nr:hypothetical protein [Photobacterium leiognathi]
MDDDADELLEGAQALGEQHENVTQRVAVLLLFYQKYQFAS